MKKILLGTFVISSLLLFNGCGEKKNSEDAVEKLLEKSIKTKEEAKKEALEKQEKYIVEGNSIDKILDLAKDGISIGEAVNMEFQGKGNYTEEVIDYSSESYVLTKINIPQDVYNLYIFNKYQLGAIENNFIHHLPFTGARINVYQNVLAIPNHYFYDGQKIFRTHQLDKDIEKAKKARRFINGAYMRLDARVFHIHDWNRFGACSNEYNDTTIKYFKLESFMQTSCGPNKLYSIDVLGSQSGQPKEKFLFDALQFVQN